ncbi:hypothetical protein RJT34_25408 [Clitoria ternatea]|uniref:PGG domain-containing protein n=1 Tax=Clitoria ternatea TaxID=43366 RepID=A0AAN9IJZ4_CLITE
MEINSLNERGMSPLDVIMLFGSEANDFEIYTTLMEAGAKRGKNIGNNTEIRVNIHNVIPPGNTTTATHEESNEATRLQEWPRLEKLEELFGYKPDRDSINDVRGALLTVAALMAAATYQFVLSPPGGLWQDDQGEQIAGKSIAATKRGSWFVVLILLNSMGFFSSLHMICYLTVKFPLQYPMLVLLSSISFMYSASIKDLVPSNSGSYSVVGVTIFSGYIIPLMPSIIRRLRCWRQAS